MDSYSGLDVFQSYSAIMSEGDDFSKLSGEMHPEKTASSAAEGVFIHTPVHRSFVQVVFRGPVSVMQKASGR